MKRIVKKTVSIVLVTIILFGSAPLAGLVGLELPSFGDLFAPTAEAATSGTCGTNLTWSLNESTGALTISGTGAMKNYSSSSYVPWYSKRSKITSVTIADGVTSIGDFAFYECTSLTSITIPDGVTSIGNRAFYYCTSLESITIPDSVTSISGCAFYNCTKLTSVTIPDSVTSIGGSAFYNTGIYNESSNWENDVLYIDNYLINAKTSISGSYTIKNGTKVVADYAFSSCTNLTSITIPDGVTSIGRSAFYKCTSLTSITIPEGVTSIGGYAFENCTKLTSVTIGDSVTSIGNSAFRGCTSLTSAYYPGTYEDWQKISIGSDNSNLTSNIIFECNSEKPYRAKGICGENLTWILHPDGELVISGTGAMKNYSSSSYVPWYSKRSKITSVTIADGVTSIGDFAFYECTSLTSITIPDSVASIGGYAFCNCTSLESITIPDSVTSIGYDAFYKCTSLTSITIPDSVTSIGSSAFRDCTSLTSITIPDGVTSIGNWAFTDCTSLVSVTIGDSVTSIGNWAFSDCTSLARVSIPADVTSIGNSAFNNCTNLLSTYYRGTYEDWQKVSIGKNNTNLTANLIFECDSEKPYYGKGTCGDNLTWILYTSGELAIDGTGDMTDYSFEAIAPWDTESGKVKAVSIGSGVTKIGDYAFIECNNINKVAYDGNAEEWDAVLIGTKNENLTKVTVTFSEYMLLWVIDGEVTDGYIEVGKGLMPPDVAPKANYSFIGWSPAVPDTMPANDMTFTAVFIKSCVCPYCGNEILGEEEISVHMMQEQIENSTIAIKNNGGSKTINYGETLRLTAVASKSDDTNIYWYVDGVKKGEGEKFDVKFDSGTKTVEAKLADANGNILKNKNGNEISASEKVTVNAGLWQKIVSFFKNLFGSDRTVVQ